jgi:hypothetical protein
MQTILSIVVFSFGLTTILPIIVDRATGGHVAKVGGPAVYGNYSPDALFPIFFLSGSFPFDVINSGIFHGMVELVRRVIRRDLVNGHVQKLETLDSIVNPYLIPSNQRFTSSTNLQQQWVRLHPLD